MYCNTKITFIFILPQLLLLLTNRVQEYIIYNLESQNKLWLIHLMYTNYYISLIY